MTIKQLKTIHLHRNYNTVLRFTKLLLKLATIFLISPNEFVKIYDHFIHFKLLSASTSRQVGKKYYVVDICVNCSVDTS